MKKSFLLCIPLLFLLSFFSTAQAGVLGTSGDYNAFIYGDLMVNNSDSQGRIAAGGNINMSNYSVGSLASPAPYSLMGGGNVTFGPGSVWNGGIFAGGDLSIRNHYIQGDVTVNGNITYPAGGTVTGSTAKNAGAASPVDFDAEFDYLKWLSGSFQSTTANGTTNVLYYAQTQITFTGSDAVNYFSLAGADLNNASNINFNVGNNIAIINVSGTADDFTTLGFAGTSGIQSNILWNFYEASNVTLNTSVKGSILAPNAHVDFNSAHVDGTIIADSLTGTGQFHQYKFDHDIPVVPEPVSSTLFIIGGAALGFRTFRKKRKMS